MASTVISALPAADCVGRIIGERFPLLERLGGTGQSSVFLTQLHGYPPRKAAIKLIPANVADADTRIARWQETSALSHPHLIQLFHAGRCNLDGVDLLYVVTECADELLSEVLRERPLSPGETREMLEPILEALTFLGGRNLVHGHLKPSNIMVVEDSLKLSSDRLHAAGEPGSTSAWSGKYSAPEAALETRSPAGDMWSLGVVVVEALTRNRPRWDRFAGGEPAVPSSIPPPFFELAWESLQVDPSRRLTLDGARRLLGTPAPSQPAQALAPTPPPPEPSALVRARLAGLALVFVIAAGGFGWLRASHHRPSAPSVAASVPPAAAVPSPVSGARTPTPPPARKPAASAPPARTLPPAQPVPVVHAPSPAPAAAAPSGPGSQAPSGPAVRGAVLTQTTPDIPQRILDTVHGHLYVRVGVQVDAAGKVTGANLDEPGPSRYFANQALKTAQSWTFTPAAIAGRPVASQWTLLFRFDQEGASVTPAETSP